MHYVHKAKFEISGFGNVEIIKGVPTVTDIILLKQENHSTETEMDGDAVAKALYDHHVSGMEGELKFWWHSHVDMPTFWSTTDMDTINELTENGWWIHGVFNKKNEYRCEHCKNVFEKGWSDAEALAEAEENFGKPVVEWNDDAVVICDDCYQKMNPKNYPNLVNKVKNLL